jgi:hypothetical protein
LGEFAFGKIKGMQSLARQMRSPAPNKGSFAALRDYATQVKHQTKYVQNFCARSVVFYVGDTGTSLGNKEISYDTTDRDSSSVLRHHQSD